MFYCTPCAKANGWPESAHKSKGRCEICELTALCSDVPSSQLPEANTNDHYFNTTNEEGDILKEHGLKANKQAVKILKFFKQKKDKFTPSQIWREVFNPDETPLTSIRRAITVLTNKGVLEKTEEKVEGIYGRPEHKWELA